MAAPEAALDNHAMIRLLVGLGNPGPEYEATGNYAAFWWIDELAGMLGGALVGERCYLGL